MMEMPSPCEACEACEEVVEFSALRRCRACQRMCCRYCLPAGELICHDCADDEARNGVYE